MKEPSAKLIALLPSELEGFMFRANPEPMWVYETASLRFLAVNDAATLRYGYSRDEFLAMTISDIRHEAEVPTLREIVTVPPLHTGSSCVGQHRTRSGEEFWAEVTSYGIDFLGRSARLVTARDVSERRRGDEENRLLAENMADIVSIIDEEGRYFYVSPSVEKATGYTVEETIRLCAQDLFHPGDLQRICEANSQALAEHNTLQKEWRRRCKDGTYRWFETKITRMPDQRGRPSRFICESRDVQQRKEAEEALSRAQAQYRGIFENAVEGIFQTTPQGRYIVANPALARIYGYASPEELIAEVGDIAQRVYVNPGRRAEFAAQMHTDGIIRNFEAQVRRRDGQIIWIRENARSVVDASGQLLHYEGTVEDITERKALEAEREKLYVEATVRADCDALTGLWNHRVFHKRLKQEDARARLVNAPYAIVLLDLNNFHYFNDTYGHASGDDVLRRVGAVFQDRCRPRDTLARFGGDEFALLLPDTDAASAESLVIRLVEEVRSAGYRPPDSDSVIPLQLTYGVAAYPVHGLTRRDVLAAADAHLLHARMGGAPDATATHIRQTLSGSVLGFTMLDALVTAVDNKDRYTRRHSEDVLVHCRRIAEGLGMEGKEAHMLSIAALLHDLGKIGIPDHILRKPGSLTPEEMEAVKQHPQMGAVIVGAVPGLEDALEAIRHHHERWDGEGYPFGLRGEMCPLSARAMSVADAYSAMTMDRPYRVGMDPQKALAILKEGAGSQWDPACVNAFLTAQNPRLRSAAA